MSDLSSLSTLEQRNSDGTGNNTASPLAGSVGAALLNIADPNYVDGLGTPQDTANAREISNAVLAQTGSEPSSFSNSDLFTFFGQFIDHDVDLTPAGSTEVLQTTVPDDDPVFDQGTVLSTHRSNPIPGTGDDDPRQFANVITSFVDASNIYGSSDELEHVLRANDGQGGKSAYLLTSQSGGLPTLAEVAAENPYADLGDVVDNPSMSNDVFIAGDIRVNENAALSSIHTIWVREHNYQVDLLKQKYPGWSDDEIFDAARIIVEAEYQNVVFNEYLEQLLGAENIPDYNGYDSTIDPAISSEFSTAAFRLGHSQLSSVLQRTDENGDESEGGHLNLFEAFFDPSNLQTEDDLASLIRGLSDGTGQEIDTHIVDDVRNLLFGTGSAGSDLGVLNILRGRDHGLGTLNETRVALGLSAYTDFSDITSDPTLAAAIQSVYASIDDVELWVGGLAEDNVSGSQLGETLHTIVLDQFMRLRDGDRFYFEYRLEDYPEILAQVLGTSLSDIMLRTTDIDYLQDDVFVAHNRIGGTDSVDELVGTNSHDLIIGFSGNDDLYGRSGDDDLYGGYGRDTMYGGSGHDILDGEQDGDVLFGGGGNDEMQGGSGSDTLLGGEGDDDLGAHTIGYAGGEAGSSNYLWGEAGDDNLWGGDGADILVGGAGADRISAGGGDDWIYVDEHDTYLNGGAGFDRLFINTSFANASYAAYALNMAVASIEVAFGGIGTDILIATGATSTVYIYGAGGVDTLYGGNAVDVLSGGAGQDYLFGDGSTDYLYSGVGGDLVNGGTGNDYLIIGDGVSGYGDGAQDTLVFNDYSGIDRVYQFDVGIDVIDLSTKTGLTSVNQLTFTNYNGAMGITYGTDTIYLIGNYHTSQFSSADFLV